MRTISPVNLLLTVATSIVVNGCGFGTNNTESTLAGGGAKAGEAFVEDLLSQMTLEEKIGQLSLFTSDMDNTGPFVRTEYIDDIKSGRVGSVFNAYTANFTRELQTMAVEESRLGIPLLFGYDVIHGFKTIFPIPLGETASWDMDVLERSARIAAVEASAAGLHWTFAPMVDVARDPRWGRVLEGAGEDTFLASKAASARVRGFQGDDLEAVDTVLACAKHLAAYGAAEGGRDYNTVDISERTLREVYLPPFKAAAEAGVATFMTAFNEIAGVPSSSNRHLLNDIVRKEWDWSGMIVSDYTSINELIQHGVARDLPHAGELAIKATVDVDLQGSVYFDHLKELVESGRVSEELVTQSARRVLLLKHQLGLFDDPYRYSNAIREEKYILSEDHRQAAREIGAKSIVLLKNGDEGRGQVAALPLSRDLKKIVIVGPHGDRKADVIGSWSAAGDAEDAVTLAEGIRSKVGDDTEVVFAEGTIVESWDRSNFQTALAATEGADVIIAAMGESRDMSGEASSRTNLYLPGNQRDFLQALKATGKPVVLVLMNGRPLILDWEQDNLNSIVETWFAGTEAGNAIADVLFGDHNPSAKLPVSFPRSIGQLPLYYNAKNTGRPFDANNSYSSRYLDAPNTPLYPFGFGLSYTTFDFANLQLSATEISRDGSLTVSVDVTNTGDLAGTETVQLYLTDAVATVTRPVKELRGFKKVALEPGETKTVTLELSTEDMKFYDLNMEYLVEPGLFRVQVGPDSMQLQTATFQVK